MSETRSPSLPTHAGHVGRRSGSSRGCACRGGPSSRRAAMMRRLPQVLATLRPNCCELATENRRLRGDYDFSSVATKRGSGVSPSKIVNIFLTACTATRVIASRVEPPTCGVTTTLGNCQRGLLGSGGSFVNASSPAPAMRPVWSATISALSSTTGPRAAFTSSAVAFIRANSAAPIMPRVSEVNGQ